MSTLPNFHLDADGIANAIRQALTDNRDRWHRLINATEIDPEVVLSTLDAMDARLGRACAGIQHLLNVYPTQAVVEGYQTVAQELSDYSDDIMRHPRLHRFMQEVDSHSLPHEQRMLFTQYRSLLHLNGYLLSESAQATFSGIQNDLNLHLEAFESNIQKSLKYLHLADGSELLLNEHAYQHFMRQQSNRDLRQKAYMAYQHRASADMPANEAYDNTQMLVDIFNGRRRMAEALGHATYWDLSLASKSLSSNHVHQLLETLLPRCLAKCQAIMQTVRDELNTPHEIQPWDIDYCLNQYIQRRWQVSLQDVADYYPIDAVLQGVFGLCEQRFGIHITELHQANVWHPDVRVFEARQQGQLLGTIYADLFAREHKNNQFSWVDVLQTRLTREDSDAQAAIIFMTCSFAGPIDTRPCLLTQEGLVRLLHEFGHVMHHLCAVSSYSGLAGTNGMAIDEVEIPSMFFERYAWQPTFIHGFARHYQTGEAMPRELLGKVYEACRFIAPIQWMQRLKMALLDMKCHDLDHDITAKELLCLVDEVQHMTRFLRVDDQSHWYKSCSLLISSQYAAGYYSYLWAEVVAADFFTSIETQGIDVAAFKTQVLAPGGALQLQEAFRVLCQRSMSYDAFFNDRHLI